MQKILQEIMKKKILGTSDASSTSRLAHLPSNPAYYIEDWLILTDRMLFTEGKHLQKKLIISSRGFVISMKNLIVNINT